LQIKPRKLLGNADEATRGGETHRNIFDIFSVLRKMAQRTTSESLVAGKDSDMHKKRNNKYFLSVELQEDQ
jgi:hypothetical protein